MGRNDMHINKLLDKIRYKHLIQASAPYIAVVIGLCYFRNAWLTLLLYHLQIILYGYLFKIDIKKLLFKGFSAKYFLAFVIPLLFFGPLLYKFFPYILNDSVVFKEWLYANGISSKSFMILIPYFCIVHPVLEEIHWGKFREYANQQWIMYVLFAGYHILVLANLLSRIWLIISFLVLVGVAYLWTVLYKKLNGGIIPFLSHLVADIGIIGVAYAVVFK